LVGSSVGRSVGLLVILLPLLPHSRVSLSSLYFISFSSSPLLGPKSKRGGEKKQVGLFFSFRIGFVSLPHPHLSPEFHGYLREKRKRLKRGGCVCTYYIRTVYVLCTMNNGQSLFTTTNFLAISHALLTCNLQCSRI
jgi:hypothetical protein